MGAADVWQALQGIGVIGILLVCLFAVSRGAYIPRASHQETVVEMAREIARLEDEVNRLTAALAARERGDD